MTRYISNTEQDRKEMLKEIGIDNIRDLFKAIPDAVYLTKALDIPDNISEIDLIKSLKALSEKNKNLDDYTCFLGAGAYDHYIPTVIDSLISRQEFYTAYTPYQPEISQGTLQTIFEYQTMICELTGMHVANASMYDGATALTEAAMMACEVTRRTEILIAKSVHPESREVLNTYSKYRNVNIVEVGYKNGQIDIDDLKSKINNNTAALLLQSPNFFGIIEDVKAVEALVHDNKSLLVLSADPISLAILESPGKLGVDIVVGEAQALGNPISFGGPYLGYFATTEKLMRKMPGRIAGQTVDSNGKRGFVLTLQTREQHIRREKATSNICSNHALNALMATIYLTILGKEGLRKLANLCIQKAHYTYKELLNTGKFTEVFTAPFFKEFVVKSEEAVDSLNDKLFGYKIIGGYSVEKDYNDIKNGWLVAVTEKRSKEEIDLLVRKAVG
jgi:glycine dehydrogenase subunit 1